MLEAKAFLDKLTEILPPATGMRHNLTIGEDGLVVCLMLGKNRYYPYGISEGDLSKDYIQLAEKIKDWYESYIVGFVEVGE